MEEHAHAAASASHAGARAADRRRLAATLVLAATYMVAEVVGGVWTGSLALLADAGHMLSDVAALGLSLFALWLAQRPPTLERTFGFHRVEILAALANGTALVAVALLVSVEAVQRLGTPREVMGAPMLAIAAGGLLVNGAGLAILHRGREGSLNVRGAWLHVLSDALGSVGALVAGGLIWAFGWLWADPVASLLIAALVLHSAWALLRETVEVLMEGAPGHVDVEKVQRALRDVEGVRDVHDLHVWTITSGLVSLSCHVASAEEVADHELLDELQRRLREGFGIDHVTIQIEPEGFDERARVC